MQSKSMVDLTMQVLLALLEAGIPLQKMDEPALHAILERGVSAAIPDSSNMRKFIPAALQVEYNRLHAELGKDTRFALITDSTTRVAEVLVGVTRFWRGGVRQRCIGLQLCKRTFTAPELVGATMKMIHDSPLELPNCIVDIFDSCATNLAAYDIQKGPFHRLVYA
jgi:hypothetical protein